MDRVYLPLGIDRFEDLRSSDCYYVDKTGFIKEVLEETFKVNLITRPRRFGKTLMMSMLAEFLDIRKDSRDLFEGLEIAGEKAFCAEWQNQWPVLFLSLKDVIGATFEDAYELLEFTISSLCGSHRELLESERVPEEDKKIFRRLLEQEGKPADVKTALVVLTRMMMAHYGKPAILLIDEYDVPLAKASDNGYYESMLNVIRSFLGMVWKTNPSLKLAVVTGCLRIAKESIFTGANNFVTRSISGKRYDRYFGFTRQEVQKLLSRTGFLEQMSKVQKWYDGYRFGDTDVYCPWDVINYVSELMVDPGAKPGNYWRDTSHNQIIRKFIDLPNMAVNEKFEILLAGGVIHEPVVEDLTYDIAHADENNLWSILYLTGYLTQAWTEEGAEAAEPGTMALRIPNEEVKTIFADTVAKWFQDSMTARDRSSFFAKWWKGEEKELTREVSDILFNTISYFDYKEDYYHAFTAGLFAGAGYEVSSNRELGTGRADLVVKDRRSRRALLIETKRAGSEAAIPSACQEAAGQMEDRGYAKGLRAKGFEAVYCYAAVFFEKKCQIVFAGQK